MVRPLIALLAVAALPALQEDPEAKQKELAALMRKAYEIEKRARESGKAPDFGEAMKLHAQIANLLKEVAGPDPVNQGKTFQEIIRKYAPDLEPEMKKAQRSANELNASNSLRTLATAQADFRANDRDGNLVNDFWVGDVSGLHRIVAGGGEIKLIEDQTALADAAPALPTHMEGKCGKDKQEVLLAKLGPSVPRAGYHFAAVPSYVDEKGKTEKYDDGSMRHLTRFAFCAYPAEHGKTGEMTFLLTEENLIWKKDTKGEAVKVVPADPAKEGWAK